MTSVSPVQLSQNIYQTKFTGSHVRIADVCKTYGGSPPLTVLANINVDIKPGEFVCILGETGCGKSTLLRIIGGFEKVRQGKVSIDGRPVDGPNLQTAIVFQEPALMPWLTVEQNVALGLKIQKRYSDSKLKIDQLLQLLGLEGFQRYYPSQLSGGMAQRVSIARALVTNPSLILLDEPFSALDILTRIHLENELANIWRKEGFTAVLVTHDVDEAISLANRIVLMTPRPCTVAQIFDISEDFPRERTNKSFVDMRATICEAFLNLTRGHIDG